MAARLILADVREGLGQLPPRSVHCTVTSPPYFGLRDYQTGQWQGGDPDCTHQVRPRVAVESSTLGGGKGTTGHQREGYPQQCARCGAVRVDQQIGLEASVEEYLATMVEVRRGGRRVLRDEGVLGLEIGDSYSGSNVSSPHTGLREADR